MPFLPGTEPWPKADPAADERAMYFAVHRKGLVVCREGGRLRVPNGAEVSAVCGPASAHYLGTLDEVNVFAVASLDEMPAPFEVVNLRGLYGDLDETLFSIAGRALQIVDWAATHRFCGRCATPTELTPGERAMRCPACKLSAYPRIAPAIIVLVRKGDLALLAHGARFPAPFYSTLAGFVEAGETLEETLLREVEEEVGIEVGDIRYFGSQSWPFPNSLMLGFFATWKSGDIAIDPTEIVDAKWFRADELPMVPPPMSISRQLIDVWLSEIKAKSAT